MTITADYLGKQLAEALDEIDALRGNQLVLARQCEELAQRNVEVSMLSYKWMAAHDALAAGKPVILPELADVPNCIAINAELLEALRVIEENADYASVRDEVFKDILLVSRAAIKKATALGKAPPSR